MGVSIYCETEEAASSRAVEEILKEAAELTRERAWMSEPIHLLERNRRLKGFSKFPPSIWSTPDGMREMSIEDWSFISWWDFRFILDALARWSRDHKVIWKLSCEGEEVGQISEGRMNEAATKFLRQMAERGGASSDESSNRQRAAEIIRRYESSLK
ncbi:MAG: hypothetical protein AB1631_20605 [Acidobacteriota bacterium]